MSYGAKKHFSLIRLFCSFMQAHFLQLRQPSFVMRVFSGVNSCPFLQWVFARLAAFDALARYDMSRVFLSLPGYRISFKGKPLFILLTIVSDFIPSLLASIHGVINIPSMVNLWVFSMFSCCSWRVDHLQFSGKYPLSLSILSSECKGLGISPISSRKFLKLDCHRSQTLIPRPPYLWYEGLLGQLQRFFMLRQVVYKG